jgi:hypothetical protein
MYLTASTLVPYLLQRGVVSESELIEDDWFVKQSYAKRPVIRVSTFAGEGWIVKQASPLDTAHVHQLDREAALYQSATKEAWARPLRKLLPWFHAYDPGVHALVLQQIAHDTAWDHLRRTSSDPRALGSLLGRALACAHLAIPPPTFPSQMLPDQRPWILDLDFDVLAKEKTPSTSTVVELLRSEPSLLKCLGECRNHWRAETLVHGDAKADNAIVRLHHRPRVWLIDWGLAGHGDPAWDVGSMMQSGLVLWLNGIMFRKDEPFSFAAENSAFPFSRVRAFARSLTSSYLRAQALSSAPARRFIRRTFHLGGARLVQSAVEHARTVGNFTNRALAMLQMSVRLLEDPDRAAADILADI